MKGGNRLKKLDSAGGEFTASQISLGCMRMSALSKTDAEQLVKTAIEEGIDFFDHADIYGGGRSEEAFAEAAGMNDDVRERLIIQTKCGIRKGYFDFSKEHIL